MFGFGKNSTDNNSQAQANPQNTNNNQQNIGMQVNGNQNQNYNNNLNLQPMQDPFQANTPAPAQLPPQNYQPQAQMPAQPPSVAEPAYTPSPQPQPAVEPAAPVNNLQPVSYPVPNPIQDIIDALKNGQTFVLEEYKFGYSKAKEAEGNPFWEEGTGGTVYGDEGGIREFLSEQSPDVIAEIKKQINKSKPDTKPQTPVEPKASEPAVATPNLNPQMSAPAPAINIPDLAPEQTPIAIPEPKLDLPATEPVVAAPAPITTSNDVDTEKLKKFVDFYESMEEAYKLAKKELEK